MHTASLQTVHASVANTRCCSGSGGRGVGWVPQVNKFEQISSIGHQMSITGGPRSDVQDPPCEQTDACENIAFPKLRWRAVIILNIFCPSRSRSATSPVFIYTLYNAYTTCPRTTDSTISTQDCVSHWDSPIWCSSFT